MQAISECSIALVSNAVKYNYIIYRVIFGCTNAIPAKEGKALCKVKIKAEKAMLEKAG